MACRAYRYGRIQLIRQTLRETWRWLPGLRGDRAEMQRQPAIWLPLNDGEAVRRALGRQAHAHLFWSVTDPRQSWRTFPGFHTDISHGPVLFYGVLCSVRTA